VPVGVASEPFADCGIAAEEPAADNTAVAPEVEIRPVETFRLELGVKLAGAELDRFVNGGIAPEGRVVEVNALPPDEVRF
jgi:hypothetical protein